jgi:RNA polymerase-binding transcription factor DksA
MGASRSRNSTRSNARTKDAEVLTSSQLRDLKAELHVERARLERSLVGVHKPDSSPSGNGSQAFANTEDGLMDALATRTSSRYAAISDALTRIELGVYGRCASCLEPIPYGRLMAMPEADRCIACGGAS